MSATFTKGERLSSFKEIQELMKKGETFFHYPFKVVWLQTDKPETNSQEPQKQNAIIVSVPKRNFKRAVKRNLLKRRIRESWRKLKHQMYCSGSDILFIYSSKEILTYQEIYALIESIISKINGRCTKAAENER